MVRYVAANGIANGFTRIGRLHQIRSSRRRRHRTPRGLPVNTHDISDGNGSGERSGGGRGGVRIGCQFGNVKEIIDVPYTILYFELENRSWRYLRQSALKGCRSAENRCENCSR